MKGNNCTLVVDLDGTLILQDISRIAFLSLLRFRLFKLLVATVLTLFNKAKAKSYVASHVELDPSRLKYNVEVIRIIKQRRESGCLIVLATGAPYKYGVQVANYLQLFDEVYTSSYTQNLTGYNKAELLKKRFGTNKFDYIGNEIQDIPVWSCCKRAYVVSDSLSLLNSVRRVASDVTIIAN